MVEHAIDTIAVSSSLRWICLLPAIGAAINLIFGLRIQRSVGRLAVAALGSGMSIAAFVVVVMNFLTLRSMPPESRLLTDHLFTWIDIGTLDVSIAYQFDPLSAVMCLVVTGIGSLIHIYSYGYMDHEPALWRFFGLLNLFMFSMLTLVLGENVLLMFVGWEGVGLCSWGLIGFWHSDHNNTTAANKAFLVNRVGDFAFICGTFIVFWTLVAEGHGTLVFREMAGVVQHLDGHSLWGIPVATLATLLLFIGATGKSAQIPLYVWLPDAMAGPTPVSALIHAATMVTAGVYMIGRLNFLFSMAPDTLQVIAFVGAATALFAASIGLTQFDIKKVLAYSTVSQLGYMFLAMGVGAYAAGIFHLVTHAFFKACLFLGSGSVIHAMHHEQDMRRMGGLRRYMPVTFWTFFISTLAIAGIPPLAGFFSKDEILWKAFLSNPVLWGIGACAAFMTAFYMFRQVFMTFFGECRADHHTVEHLHESAAPMTMPLVVLAFGAITVGWLGIPHALGGNNLFEQWLEPVFAASHVEAQGQGGAHATAAAHGEGAHGAAAHGEAAHAKAAPPDSHGKGGTHGDPAHGEATHGEGVVGGEHHDLTTEYLLMGVSIALASTGIFLAYLMYGARRLNPDSFARVGGGLPYRLSYNKYYVDEVYHALFVRGAINLSRGLAWFDAKVVDGIVNLTATITHAASAFNGAFDKYVVDGLVNFTASTFDRAGGALRLVQTGSINAYLYVILIGVTLTLLANAW
ncbi:MAG TPA: NADH-quinone oxidoreductase subunit L [Candidatus Limnocylindrales bacterium]|nr:NADH-quinone oxidoreductase subunit L [Candidatus Limnocylindrales bacterium]